MTLQIPAFARHWHGRGGIGSRFARGAAWSLLGTAGSQAFALVASVVCARVLGREGFGQLAMVNSTIGTFGSLAGMGIGLTATKYCAEFRNANPARAGRIASLSLMVSAVSAAAMAVVLAGVSRPLAAGLLRAPELGSAVQVGSLLLLANTLLATLTGCLAGFEAFKAIATVNVLQACINLPAVVGATLLWGVIGAVGAAAAASCCGCCFAWLRLRGTLRVHGVRIAIASSLAEWRVLHRFSIPALLSGIMVAPVSWLANTVLARCPGGYSELGLFNAANQWRTIALFLPTILLQVTLPLLSSSFAENEDGTARDYRRTLELTQTATVLVAYPLCILFMFLAPLIMSIYGPSFGGRDGVLIGVSLTAVVISCGGCTGPALQAEGRMWLAFAINSIWGVLMLAFVGLTAARFGALSLAWGGAAAYLLTTIWTCRRMRYSLGARFVRRTYAVLAFAVVLAAAAGLLPRTAKYILAAPACLGTVWLLLSTMLPAEVKARLRTVLPRGRIEVQAL